MLLFSVLLIIVLRISEILVCFVFVHGIPVLFRILVFVYCIPVFRVCSYAIPTVSHYLVVFMVFPMFPVSMTSLRISGIPTVYLCHTHVIPVFSHLILLLFVDIIFSTSFLCFPLFMCLYEYPEILLVLLVFSC